MMRIAANHYITNQIMCFIDRNNCWFTHVFARSAIMSLLKWVKHMPKSQSVPQSVEDDDIPSSDVNNNENTPGEVKTAGEVKLKRIKKFQTKWLSEFTWLRFENGTMFCKDCEGASRNRKSLTGNAFVKGTGNFQRSSLTRHMMSDDHELSKKIFTQRRYMTAARAVISKGCLPALEAQMRTAALLAEENIPNRKFLKLIDLQIANGSSAFLDRKAVYTNHQAAATMQKYISNVLQEMSITRIKNSPYLGIMLDESLDIATNKKLVLFCKIIHNDAVKIEFCANVTIKDGKAETVYNCIVSWMQENGICMNKISSLGSDRASVMMGKVSGVGVRLKAVNPRVVHIWCAAHKLALVSYWAAKKVNYFDKVNEMLIAIFNFYNFSAPRYTKLKELQRILGGKVKRFKKPTQVRWLSMSDAVKAVFDSYSALVLGLEHEVANNPKSEGGNKAKGILKVIKTFRFVSILCLLKDILDNLDRVSKTFQKDSLDIESLKSLILATKNTMNAFVQIDPPAVSQCVEQVDEFEMYQGIPMFCSLQDRLNLRALRQKYCRNLVLELEQRFPPDDLGVLHSLNAILSPKQLPMDDASIETYGVESLEKVISMYGVGQNPQINPVRTRNSYMQFKYIVNVNREKSLESFCIMITKDLEASFPDYVVLAGILVTCPLTSVPCERGFSLQNRHHNAVMCRRNVENVQNRMFIEYNMRHMSGEEKDEAVRRAAQLM